MKKIITGLILLVMILTGCTSASETKNIKSETVKRRERIKLEQDDEITADEKMSE